MVAISELPWGYLGPVMAMISTLIIWVAESIVLPIVIKMYAGVQFPGDVLEPLGDLLGHLGVTGATLGHPDQS